MRDGFHLALIKEKGGFEKCLAVARGARANDTRALGQFFL